MNPTIKIYGQVGLNPPSLLGETGQDTCDSEILALYAVAGLLRELASTFEVQAAQVERDYDEIEGLG